MSNRLMRNQHSGHTRISLDFKTAEAAFDFLENLQANDEAFLDCGYVIKDGLHEKNSGNRYNDWMVRRADRGNGISVERGPKKPSKPLVYVGGGGDWE